ncbi:MAG: hypothetical protein ACM3O6_13430 [Acidobacteriota bacterium]
MTRKGSATAPEQVDFSLVLGGPLYQLLLRAGLIQPSMAMVQRRIIAAAVITWLPLAVLTALGGGFLGGVSVPFLYDLDVHVRFLIALPMLIGAELIVHSRLRAVVGQFRERNLIAPEDRGAFENIVSGTMRLRNSVTIEITLLVIAFVAFYGLWRSQASLGVASWYAAVANDAISFTWAGYWYVFVAVPIFRFILLRWYFRIFIWYVFLFRVSRLRLQLEVLHPDKAGGLEFLSASADAISPVLLAQSIFISGVIGNEIWHAGRTLPEFQLVIGAVAAFLLLLALLPLGFFAAPMAAAKRTALPGYGTLATRYVREFRQKWLQVSQTRDKELLGSADIQSLSDLGTGYAVAHDMRLLPFGRNVVVRLVIVIALPLLPLALTMFPFEVILQQLVKIVL